jgi:AcrR family transcriptional regulator
MPRWETGSEERLKQATMELFEEKGFDDTSVVEIARRAGVTTRTFFRYFTEKRDVLFDRSEALRAALVDRVLEAPDVNDPLRVVVGALTGYDWDSLGRDVQRRRQAVIAANPQLLERDLIKREDIVVAFAGALRGRGVDEDTARLAARVGSQLFFTAYEKWLADGGSLTATTERLSALLAATVGPGTPAAAAVGSADGPPVSSRTAGRSGPARRATSAAGRTSRSG